MTEQKKQRLITAIVTAVETVIDSEEDTKIRQDQPTEMLTIREAAQTIKGLSEYTVRQLVAQGKVPSIRTGTGKNGKILVPKYALLKHLTGAQ